MARKASPRPRNKQTLTDGFLWMKVHLVHTSFVTWQFVEDLACQYVPDDHGSIASSYTYHGAILGPGGTDQVLFKTMRGSLKSFEESVSCC